jgi:SAM-dependent methyltransferase
MKSIDIEGFEQKFRQNIDPWNYTHSRFEHFKRTMLLRACGHRKHGRVLELGCAIGETTRYLAPLSMHLLAVDASPTALKEAKRRLSGEPRVIIRRATLPGEFPHGPYDLIVVSEIAYYLHGYQLVELGKRIRSALAFRGRAVVLNHRRPFEDAAQLPALAHRDLRTHLARTLSIVSNTKYFRFDVVVLERSYQ